MFDSQICHIDLTHPALQLFCTLNLNDFRHGVLAILRLLSCELYWNWTYIRPTEAYVASYHSSLILDYWFVPLFPLVLRRNKLQFTFTCIVNDALSHCSTRKLVYFKHTTTPTSHNHLATLYNVFIIVFYG